MNDCGRCANKFEPKMSESNEAKSCKKLADMIIDIMQGVLRNKKVDARMLAEYIQQAIGQRQIELVLESKPPTPPQTAGEKWTVGLSEDEMGKLYGCFKPGCDCSQCVAAWQTAAKAFDLGRESVDKPKPEPEKKPLTEGEKAYGKYYSDCIGQPNAYEPSEKDFLAGFDGGLEAARDVISDAGQAKMTPQGWCDAMLAIDRLKEPQHD